MLKVDGVTKRFDDLVAVDDVSFTVDRGEVVGFLGPNGAGKTTTMRMITGTLEPDEGGIQFEGVGIQDDLVAAKRRVGYLPEANPLYDDMLVADYLGYAGRLHGLAGAELRTAVADAADQTDLSAVFYRPIGQLSKGYRQRVGLAAAILHKPALLVLDEPTEGLDPNQRVEIRKLVAALGSEHTVLLSTHVMQEVEATCQRLLIITEGRLVADGSVRDMLDRGRGSATYVVEGTGTDLAASLGQLPGVRDVTPSETEGRTRVRVAATGDDLRPLIFGLAKQKDWTLWELRLERASLEDVFRDLTAATPAASADAAEPAHDPEAA